jgi:hypothetical protein
MIIPINIDGIKNFIIYGIDISILIYHHIDKINIGEKLKDPHNGICYIDIYLDNINNITSYMDTLEYNYPVYTTIEQNVMMIYPIQDLSDNKYRCITKISVYDKNINTNINIHNSLLYIDTHHIYCNKINKWDMHKMDVIDFDELTFYYFIIENICKYINDNIISEYIKIDNDNITPDKIRLLLQCSYNNLTDYVRKCRMIYNDHNFLSVYSQSQNKFISDYIYQYIE